MSLEETLPLKPEFDKSTDPTPPVRRASPFSLRFSGEDRARLERDAAGMSLAAYIRWRLFDPESKPPRHRGKAPVKDHQALSAVLALLGKSGLSNNLNQLARAVHTGSLPVSPDVEVELREAFAEITAMRALLIDALGLREDLK